MKNECPNCGKYVSSKSEYLKVCEYCGLALTKNSNDEYVIDDVKIKEVEEMMKQEEKILTDIINNGFVVTTMDLKEEYEIISPVIFNTTNRGIFSSHYDELNAKYYQEKYKRILVTGEMSHKKTSNIDALQILSLLDLNPLSFEGNVGYRQFDRAFYISIAELKIRARKMGGDAIIGLKADFDLDTTNFGAFYLQMFGTVVRIKK